MQYSTFITASGIVRCDIFSNNFKTDCITVNLFMPLDIETASSIALLSAVLKRGNEKFGEMDTVHPYQFPHQKRASFSLYPLLFAF